MNRYESAPSHRLRTAALIVLVLVLLVGGYAWLRGGAPAILPIAVPAAVGQRKTIEVGVSSPAGVAAVELSYQQGGKTILLGARTFSGRRVFSTGDAPVMVHMLVQAGQQAHPELKNGPAELVVRAWSANLRASEATLRRQITVETTPPAVYSLSTQQYINQGGADMVIYHVSASASSSGVEMGGVFFPGYPLPNAAPGTMFCLYAFPYNAPANSQPELVAHDAAGNQATATFPVRTFPQKFRSREEPISTRFIQQVVMPIIAHTPGLRDQGDPVKNFVLVDRTLRQTETEDLLQAAKKTVLQFLWSGAFLQLPHSKVEAMFADHRIYTYHGQVIDQADHLGYDLASVEHAPIPAANAGRVVWAKYFGIYGNCVLLDHGYGLMTLYGHMNDFTVKAGDLVAKGQIIGHTDSTGLAEGDHLHFSVLVDGVQVNPVEWWDPNWVHSHIVAKLEQFSRAGTALPRG